MRPLLQSEATSQRSPVPCLQPNSNAAESNGNDSNTALTTVLLLFALPLWPLLFMLGAGLARRAHGRPLRSAIAWLA